MAHQMSMTEEQLKDWRMPQLKELVKQLIVQKNNKKCAKKTHCAMIRTQRSKHTRLSLLSGCCCVVVVKVTVLVNSYTLTSLHYPLCLLGCCGSYTSWNCLLQNHKAFRLLFIHRSHSVSALSSSSVAAAIIVVSVDVVLSGSPQRGVRIRCFLQRTPYISQC